MSETTYMSATTKLDQMSAVQTAIEKTGMATASLWNPYPRLAEFGVNLGKITAAAAGGPGQFSTAKQGMAIDVIPDGPRHLYVHTGAASYARLTSGNCSLFACCVIGMLAARPELTGPGVTVELFNVSDGMSDGHEFVVAGRTGTGLTSPIGFGPGCYFIDQWYARHRGTSPGNLGVKDPATVPDSKFSDPVFFDFVLGCKVIKPILVFTSDDLAQLAA